MLKTFYVISLVIALSLFLGLFFGLGYPEIKRAEYISTTCTITNETITSRYCCYRDCDFTCQNAPSSSPSCSSLESRWNAFSPTKCATALKANNSQNIDDYCPIDGPQATCDNGYYCCDECCQKCTSCSNNNTCTTYSCNCSCCNYTNHQSCQIKCPECYTLKLMVQYPIWGGKTITSNISVDYDQSITDAQNYITTHPVESNVRCYYNPENPLQVLLSIDYSVRTWVLVGISAFILFVMLAIGTYYIFYKVPFLQDISYRIFSLQSGIWIGTIVPLLFFFLLLVPITNKYVLLMLSLCFISIGWTPLLISSIIKFKRKSFSMACFITFLFFILPITIFGSTAMNISFEIMKILLIVLAIITPIGYIFWITEIWNKLYILFIFWITEIWNKLYILLTRLFHNTFNEEKNSPINIANRNENPIIDDSAPPTYEEAIAIP
ncbi:11003_t:CDS:1 [Dentiscutata erythropus]|uniref:11003_t:CDS:1 n=1 Tax=Dentiscutata erythropus TaxID=1348616 RepID=A0A9N9G315_9GLOM|nr:11003_t:CDS:1 [Dentiscutata erythropus]